MRYRWAGRDPAGWVRLCRFSCRVEDSTIGLNASRQHRAGFLIVSLHCGREGSNSRILVLLEPFEGLAVFAHDQPIEVQAGFEIADRLSIGQFLGSQLQAVAAHVPSVATSCEPLIGSDSVASPAIVTPSAVFPASRHRSPPVDSCVDSGHQRGPPCRSAAVSKLSAMVHPV